MTTSPLTEHLLEYLNEGPSGAPAANLATVLHQGERAQQWLLSSYLAAWLEVIGDLPKAGYPRAFSRGRRLQRIAQEAAELAGERTNTEWIFFLESLTFLLRGACADVNKPDERAMQWGLWARDVPMAVVCGFGDTKILDATICDAVAPAAMYAAFLVGMIVEDQGVSEEIEQRMFEDLPRELLTLLRDTPVAPEA